MKNVDKYSLPPRKYARHHPPLSVRIARYRDFYPLLRKRYSVATCVLFFWELEQVVMGVRGADDINLD